MQWKHFSYTVTGWKKVFRSYVVINGDGARRLAQTKQSLHSFTFDDGANPNFATPDAGSRWQHLRYYVHRRFENR